MSSNSLDIRCSVVKEHGQTVEWLNKHAEMGTLDIWFLLNQYFALNIIEYWYVVVQCVLYVRMLL